VNIAKLMQDAQKAQQQMQSALAELEVEGSSGGGMVIVRLNGLKELKGVKIDTKALAGEESSLWEDLVMAAWEEATRKLEERSKEILGRFGLPPGLKGMF
jgi:nucleoid-associated protein EbfC